MFLTQQVKALFVVSILASVSTGLHAQQSTARIKIDTDRIIGEVHPHVFGNFAEHLGRCIYGGIYEEGSPLSDADGFRKDVMEATRAWESRCFAGPAAISRRDTTGKTASDHATSVQRGRTTLGEHSSRTVSVPMSFCATAND
jgi:hypothetical protein